VAEGGRDAWNELFELVYPELRKTAGEFMRRERLGHTLSPTDLVGELCQSLEAKKIKNWKNRGHFFAYVQTAFKHLLIDYARKRGRRLEGQGGKRVEAGDDLSAKTDAASSLLDHLDLFIKAVHKLRPLKENEMLRKIFVLRFFENRTFKEIGEKIGISARKVKTYWGYIKTKVFHEMERTCGDA